MASGQLLPTKTHGLRKVSPRSNTNVVILVKQHSIFEQRLFHPRPPVSELLATLDNAQRVFGSLMYPDSAVWLSRYLMIPDELSRDLTRPAFWLLDCFQIRPAQHIEHISRHQARSLRKELFGRAPIKIPRRGISQMMYQKPS